MFLFGVLLASAHATQMVSASVFLLLDRSIREATVTMSYGQELLPLNMSL